MVNSVKSFDKLIYNSLCVSRAETLHGLCSLCVMSYKTTACKTVSEAFGKYFALCSICCSWLFHNNIAK